MGSKRYPFGFPGLRRSAEVSTQVAAEFPHRTYFAGRVRLRRERHDRILHNATALALQKRMMWANETIVIVPARVY